MTDEQIAAVAKGLTLKSGESILWLWCNHVDGKPEYWAFDNPYPTFAGGDPMVIGQPCGYAIFKESTPAYHYLQEQG